MKINKILPTPSLNKIWSELTKITNKLITLEELVMNNATSSEIFENARQRIVNSALGKALGLSADTSILDTAIEIEGVIDNSGVKATNATLDVSNSRVQLDVPSGYYDESSKLYTGYSTLASLIGLSADKLISGNTILGITGDGKSIETLTSGLQMQIKHSTSCTTQSITCPADCEFAIGFAVAYSSYSNHTTTITTTSPYKLIYGTNIKNSKAACVAMRSGDTITANNASAESNTRYTNIVAVIYKLKA